MNAAGRELDIDLGSQVIEPVTAAGSAVQPAPATSSSTSTPTPTSSSSSSSSSQQQQQQQTKQHLPTSSAPQPTTPVTTASTVAATTVATTITTTTTATTPLSATNESFSDSLVSNAIDDHRTPSSDNLSKTNLYIRGLTTTTSDQDLYNMCTRFGQISSTKAILDKTTGFCRGYGFVEFITPQAAELAVLELSKSGIQAQMAQISPLYSSHHNHQHHHNNNNSHHHHHHQQQHHHHHHHHNNYNNKNSGNSNNNNTTTSNSSRNSNNNTTSCSNVSGNATTTHQNYQNSSSNNNADPTNLYIANLPPNMSEQELEILLSTYGPVVSTRILRDESHNPRGVGFARMESRDKCEQIIEQLNGRVCKGWKEPLLVKFADGGNKRRQHHHNLQHHHHNNNHHQHHKVHQDDNRWRDNSGSTSDPGSVSSFEHQSNISLSNHLSDLAMMSTISYPQMQPGFSPTVASGAAYPAPLGPPTSAPRWIHPGGPGQPPYVISQQMIQAGGLSHSDQAAAAAAALHYGHIPQLTSQMQGLQIAHPGAPVGAGYLPHQHQWSTLWAHPIPQQPQPSMRLPVPQLQQPQPSTQQPPQQQQCPQPPTPVQQANI